MSLKTGVALVRLATCNGWSLYLFVSLLVIERLSVCFLQRAARLNSPGHRK